MSSKRLISLLLVTAFLYHNLAWAEDSFSLAPSADQRWADLGRVVQESPPGVFTFPATLSSAKRMEVAKIYTSARLAAAGGVIRGRVRAGKVIFSSIERKKMPARLRKRIFTDLNWLISELAVFGDGTEVRIVANSSIPVFFNKDSNVLDIHGALFLSRGVRNLLHFISLHDARHKIFKYLSPLWEEVLNIYLDQEYLDSLAWEACSDIEDKLEEFLDCNEGDVPGIINYCSLVRERSERADLQKQSGFLDKILIYIRRNCPDVIAKMGLRSNVTINELRSLLAAEKEDPASPISFLVKAAETTDAESAAGFSKDIHVFLPRLAAQLTFAKIIDFFSDLDNQLSKIYEACRETPLTAEEIIAQVAEVESAQIISVAVNARVLSLVYDCAGEKKYLAKGTLIDKEDNFVKGYDLAHNREVYISLAAQDELFAKEFILAREIRERYKGDHDFFDMLWPLVPQTDRRQNFDVAICLARWGASKFTVAAGILAGVSGLTERQLIKRGVDRNDAAVIITILKRHNRIVDVLDLPLAETNRAVQNLMNFIVEYSNGNADVIFLTMASNLFSLRRAVRENLSGGFHRKTELICAPLADCLGREDIAAELREASFQFMVGTADYEEQEEEILEIVNDRGEGVYESYQELRDFMAKVEDIVKQRVADLPVAVKSRVKSPSAWYYKKRYYTALGAFVSLDMDRAWDIFGLQFIIMGTHTPKELWAIHAELTSRMQELFYVYKHDRKRMEEKEYGAYHYKLLLSESSHWQDLRTIYGTAGSCRQQIEVQVYTSMNDYLRYRYGPTAHWLYKLERMLKIQGIGSLSFDRDLLRKTYPQFREGNLAHNLRLLYRELRFWKIIGVINKENKLRFVRVPAKSGIAFDVASAPSIERSLRRGGAAYDYRQYQGLARVEIDRVGAGGSLETKIAKVIKNDDPAALRSDIYKVVVGGLSETKRRAIKRTTKKPRAYMQISAILKDCSLTEELAAEGKRLVDSCIRRLASEYSIEYLENNIFTKIDRGKDIGLKTEAYSLENQVELYQILALANRRGEENLLRELVRRTYQYMTGIDLKDSVNLKELRKTFRIKKNLPRIAPLVYLFTVAARGEKLLNQELRAFGIDISHPATEGKKMLLFDNFAVENLCQLYGKIGLDQVLAKVAGVYVKGVIKPPFIFIHTADYPGVVAAVQQVAAASGLEGVYCLPVQNGIEVKFKPTLYWSERVDLVVEELRDIKGVQAAIFTHERQDEVVRRLEFSLISSIASDQQRDVIESLNRLFELSSFGVPNLTRLTRERKRGVRTYVFHINVNVARTIGNKDLEALISYWLEARVPGVKVDFARIVIPCVQLSFSTAKKGEIVEGKIHQALAEHGFIVEKIKRPERSRRDNRWEWQLIPPIELITIGASSSLGRDFFINLLSTAGIPETDLQDLNVLVVESSSVGQCAPAGISEAPSATATAV